MNASCRLKGCSENQNLFTSLGSAGAYVEKLQKSFIASERMMQPVINGLVRRCWFGLKMEKIYGCGVKKSK